MRILFRYKLCFKNYFHVTLSIVSEAGGMKVAGLIGDFVDSSAVESPLAK